VRKRGNAIVARIIDSAIDPGRDGTLRPYSRFLETGSAGGGGRKGSTRGRVHRTRTFEERKRGATTRRIQEQRPYLSTALEQSRNMIKSRIEHAILHGIELKPTAKPARARKSPSAP